MPYLVVMDGPQKGRRFALADDATRIGRVVGNHIVLDNASVSSGHAEIIKGSDGFRLRDLDSTNGTRVNGHRITDTILFRDDEVLFGDLQVLFGGEDAPVRQTPITPVNAPVSSPAHTPPPVPATPPPKKDPGAVPQTTVARAAVIVASSASGKHASVSMPRDFKRRHDVRLLWIAIIALLLIGVGYGFWKFYNVFH